MFPRIQHLRFVGALVGLALFAGATATAYGQGGLIGSRGGLLGPTTPTTPVLPSTLNLPPLATSSLLDGLNAGGTALRPGMGWLTSDLTHEGIQGQQLSDVIHQLHPYMQQGRLTFPQNAQGSNFQGSNFQGSNSQGLFPGLSQQGQGLPWNGKGLGNAFGRGWRRR